MTPVKLKQKGQFVQANPAILAKRGLDRCAHFLGGVLRRCWPQPCFVCGQMGLDTFCGVCVEELPFLGVAHCPRCALPSPSGQCCGACLRRMPHFDASHAVFAYDFPARDILLAYKYGQLRLAKGLAEMVLAKGLALNLADVDVIVPMPLHVDRLAERGFNQSLELARLLARALEIPLRHDLVQRQRATPRLGGLRKKERARVVRGAFVCRADLHGAKVLVIDDVMTSGASLNELAHTLKKAGAASVTNLILARVMQRQKS